MALAVYYFFPKTTLSLYIYYNIEKLGTFSPCSYFSPHIIYNSHGFHPRAYFSLSKNILYQRVSIQFVNFFIL